MWGHRRDRRAWRRRRRLRSRGRLAVAGFGWAAELTAREAAVLVASHLAPEDARRSAAEQELAAVQAAARVAAPATAAVPAAAKRSALQAGRQE